MTIRLAIRSLAPFALLALLSACDRPKGPPPPKADPANAASQAAPSTVALSGTILDPQPDPATVKPARPAGKASASVGTANAGRVASGSVGAYTSGAGGRGSTQRSAEQVALRDFQAEQERRDRELLDQDLSEAQRRTREDAWERERANAAGDGAGAAPRVGWNEGRGPYQQSREDDDWSQSNELPPDELPPYDEDLIDEPPFEELPYDDEPLPYEGYDPRDGAYRP